MNQIPDSSENLKTMSFGGHLEELRGRLLRSIFVVIIFGAVAFVYQNQLMQLVTGPHRLALSQIEGSRMSQTIQEHASSGRELLEGLSPEVVSQVLQSAGKEEDWWNRWTEFREQQAAEGPVAELVELLEQRISHLEQDSSSSRVLAGVTSRFLNSSEQLKVVLVDAPWGSAGRLEATVKDLEEMARLWSDGSTTAGSDLENQETVVTEEATAVVVVDTGPEIAPEDPEVLATLQEVAGLSVTIEDLCRELISWRSKALPLALLSYSEAFFSYVKLSLLIGLLCALPWFTMEIWQFIAAGLYPTERSVARPFLPVAFLLMALGVTFAYMVLIPIGLSFLGGYGDPQLVRPVYTLKEYLGLV
ncbi:MAG: twin-arginine translocase subunit TatC, partial [Planctomycetota bacterium]